MRETELSKNTQLLNMFEGKMREVQGVIERDAIQRRQYVQALHKSLIEREQAHRRERRIWLNE